MILLIIQLHKVTHLGNRRQISLLNNGLISITTNIIIIQFKILKLLSQ